MKFLIAFLCLSLIINMYAMEIDVNELDEDRAVIIMVGLQFKNMTPNLLMPKPIIALKANSQSGEYPDEFYKQIIIRLRQEKQACADTTSVHVYQECKGCGDSISQYKTVTHLVNECTLSKVLSEKIIVNSGQKIDMQVCQVCRMKMPAQIFLLHKFDRCQGPEYRIKKRRNITSSKNANKKIKIESEEEEKI